MNFIIDLLKRTWTVFKQSFIGIIIGIIIAFLFTAYANSVPSAQVTYSHSKTSQTTVKGALDELIDLANTTTYTDCAEGYVKGETTSTGYNCKNPICRRAATSTLHTETCNQTSNNCVATRGNGHTITYGNTTTTTGTLNVGDAFDCDVLGDGSYEVNGEAARFYYVSTMNNGHSSGTDSSIAVLVYYTNTDTGHNSTSGASWSTGSSNTSGPDAVASHLPGVGRSWPGVSLKNSTRRISNENGSPVVDFNYGNAQARLLTYQEVHNGCYDGSTAITSTNGLYSKCEFLFENTKYTDSSRGTYGSWLETPTSSDATSAWLVFSNNRLVNYSNVNYPRIGVRPAIEVPLEDIDY